MVHIHNEPERHIGNALSDSDTELLLQPGEIPCLWGEKILRQPLQPVETDNL